MKYMKRIYLNIKTKKSLQVSKRLSEIWNYSVKKNEWSLYSNMLTPRGEHVVVPVAGIDCG